MRIFRCDPRCQQPQLSRVPRVAVGHFYANHTETLGLRLGRIYPGASTGRFANRLRIEPSGPGLDRVPRFIFLQASDAGIRRRRAQLSSQSGGSFDPPERKPPSSALGNFPCLVIARNSQTPSVLLDIASQFETPVFRGHMITMKFIDAATIALEFDFAPSTQEYGTW